MDIDGDIRTLRRIVKDVEGWVIVLLILNVVLTGCILGMVIQISEELK
jgi:hypothetical protein